MSGTHLNIYFVTAQNYWDVLADALEIAMPVGHVLVRDSRGHVKHNDTTLALDVVSISQPAKLFLASCIPHVEADGAEVGVEGQWVYFDSESG